MEVLNRNVANNMSDLEIKGYVFSFLQKTENRKKLMRYFEAVEYIEFGEDLDFEEDIEASDFDLTPEQEADLVEAIAETYDPTKLIDHEDVMKKYAKWLK
jgi:hypothetical protein